MIFAPLLGLSLVVATATGPITDEGESRAVMTNQQKSAAMQSLVRSATECIARTVGADPRFAAHRTALGDLIVDSVTSCADQVRQMIDAHDAYFGEGTGEKFFMGPYLDVLPTAVSHWLKTSAQH